MCTLRDEAFLRLEISIVLEKEEEEGRGRVESPSVSDKVSDIDENRAEPGFLFSPLNIA